MSRIVPKTSSYYQFHYYVLVPTLCVGLPLNTVVIAGLMSGRRRLMNSQVDTVLASMVILLIAYSILQLSNYTAAGFYLPAVGLRIIAALNSILWMFLFTANAFLAISRSSVVSGGVNAKMNHERLQLWILVQAGIGSCVTIWVFSTSNSTTAVIPDNAYQALVWVITMGVIQSSTNATILVFYARTYWMSRSLLSTMEDEIPEAFRTRMSYQLTFNCAVMSLVFMVYYFPSWTMAVVVALGHYSSNDYIMVCAFEWLLYLDVVVTPILVLYFKPSLRAWMWGLKWGSEMEVESMMEEVEEEVTKREFRGSEGPVV
ncbi:hypothetical protein HDU98_009467 [Podochytrium sp. JEL0797]|nr:hypothetical protein HDU98_009467 [Podochytrium sp. JEL0797]